MKCNIIYQVKSKLYFDLASFVNCNQNVLDVKDEKSNDSKTKLKKRIEMRYLIDKLSLLIDYGYRPSFTTSY
jgi:hypothetical protein